MADLSHVFGDPNYSAFPIDLNETSFTDTGQIYTENQVVLTPTQYGQGGGGDSSQGVQNVQGVQGVQGAQGIQGAQGLQGFQGTQGIQGTQGTQGIKGLQGTQGVQGLQGVQGVQGTQGTQGLQGVQGIQGAMPSIESLNFIQKVTSTDNAAVRFDGISGNVGNSSVLIFDDGTIKIPLGTNIAASQNPHLEIGNIWIGTGSSGGTVFGKYEEGSMKTYYTFDPTSLRVASAYNGQISLGTSQYKWKDLYISGKINNISIPDASGTMALTRDIPQIPNPTSQDAGKMLVVNENGEYELVTIADGDSIEY